MRSLNAMQFGQFQQFGGLLMQREAQSNLSVDTDPKSAQ
ncbi:hypothetical protein SynA1840_02577 [Synechococcus sp. A18-40]|nr:hypothetical protein SynA1840_02577 [Synechococcus sp. A18-40]